MLREPQKPMKRRRADRSEAYRDWMIIAAGNHLLMIAITAFSLPLLGFTAASIMLGVGFAAGAITVLHDAGHGRFSRNYLPNMLVVHSAAPIGLWVAHWTLKHKVHHRMPAAYPDDE